MSLSCVCFFSNRQAMERLLLAVMSVAPGICMVLEVLFRCIGSPYNTPVGFCAGACAWVSQGFFFLFLATRA